jgi:hypothetical protein
VGISGTIGKMGRKKLTECVTIGGKGEKNIYEENKMANFELRGKRQNAVSCKKIYVNR